MKSHDGVNLEDRSAVAVVEPPWRLRSVLFFEADDRADIIEAPDGEVLKPEGESTTRVVWVTGRRP